MHKQNRMHGFTLVELLIVIVVIAILAAITAVSYRGLKDRADASATITHVKQYATIIETYIADHGRAPTASWRCLGDATTLPAENGYEVNFCFKYASNHDGSCGGCTAPADPALMAELVGVYGQLPNARFPEAPGLTDRTLRGIIYDGSTNNFVNNPAVIVYFTKLPSCPIGDEVGWWTGTDSSGCAYRLSVNENGVPR